MFKCMMKNAFFMGLGVGATIMYQKYSKSIFGAMEKVIDKTIKDIDSLDEMM